MTCQSFPGAALRSGETLRIMKREDLARTLARETQQTPAQARDQIDDLVHRILCSLRNGQPVELPGVGKLVSSKPTGPKAR
jgi:nucleoid DNA-binding protein